MKKLICIICLLASSVFAGMETGTVTRIKVLSPQGKELTIELDGWTIQYDSETFHGLPIGVTVGTNGIVTAGRIVCNEADIEASDPYRGLILHDTNSVGYVISVDPSGAVFTTEVTASPEIPFSNRVDKINEKLERRGQVRRSMKTYSEADVSIASAVAWTQISTNLSVTLKAGNNDKILVTSTIYGKADATKLLKTSLFMNGNNKGTGTHGLAYTDAETVSNIGFTWMSKKLDKGTYTLDLRARGRGTIVSGDVQASMAFILIEPDW